MESKRAVVICYLSLAILVFWSCRENPPVSTTTSPPDINFNVPNGFELEELYQPSKNGQGSWVALAEGPNNLIYACDQYGKIYFFKSPRENSTLKKSEVDSISLEVGEAHGLLWAFNSLYVAVNKNWDDEVQNTQEFGSGIYRLTDTDNDGNLDHKELLLKLSGSGEHGPHSLVLDPKGEHIYFIAGNHVLIPEKLQKNSRLPTNWAEDNLFRPYLDARGHANDIKAPGGWIAKLDPKENAWELIAAGFRNPFDMAFNKDGELFAYDADMEWDIGMPWYRPTRICHVTSGAEFGWRTGSGKWPEYYPDNLPAVQNLEQGSPTAVLSGAKLNFPGKYQNGLFVMDWSFGTVYFVDLQPKGSSYTGGRQEFLSGTPLPLTDMISATDGNMYFATGGRKLDSRLYRLSYTEDVDRDTKSSPGEEATELRRLRHQLEAFHNTTPSKEAIALAWKNLDHRDRFVRYAARLVLEHHPVHLWESLYTSEKNNDKRIEATIALTRKEDQDLKDQVLKQLNAIAWNNLDENRKVDLLRTYSLLFTRHGSPSNTGKAATIAKLNPYFPDENYRINRELGQLLLFLQADGITEKLVQLLERHTNEKTVSQGMEMLSKEASMRSEQYGPLIREVIEKMPPSEAIYYGMLLSHAKKGWTKELREKYFLWYYDVLAAKGGMSFKAYMENIRQQAMEHVPKEQKAYFEELSGTYSPSTAVSDLPQPIGPGSNYTGDDIGAIVWGGLENYKVTISKGKRAYEAAMCITCHRMKGEGGGTGPDLTQAHTKFNAYDMLFAIYSPNDEISDQYANTLFEMKDGRKLAGRILSEKGDSISLAPNPFNESYIITLAKDGIKQRGLSPISPMPPGLLNRLNENEIRDLFAYVMAGGDKDHEIYTGEKSTVQ